MDTIKDKDRVTFGQGIIILLALICSWGSFWAITALIINNKIITNAKTWVFFTAILVVSLVLRQSKIKKSVFVHIMVFDISLITLVLINYMNVGFSSFIIRSDIQGYGWAILISFCLLVNFNINSRKAQMLVSLFIIPQMILGIVQFYLSKPVIPINDGNNPVVNTIFYLNGSSSNDINWLSVGAKVRAFGMTDSGLTLGVIGLLALSISLNTKSISKWFRLILLMIAIVTIYATLTRNVYVGAVYLVILSTLNIYSETVKKVLKFTFVGTMTFSFVGVFLNDLLNLIGNFAYSHGIFNFSIRYLYLSKYLQEMNSASRWLFGMQMKPSTINPIDNGVVACLVDKGLIFTLLIFAFITVLFFKLIDRIDRNNKSFLIFMMTFPILSFANTVTSVYGYIFIIIIMCFNFGDTEGVEDV